MHVHLPKPLHGWRAFAGEVGIIVVGVLIALSAEQFVGAAMFKKLGATFGRNSKPMLPLHKNVSNSLRASLGEWIRLMS